MKFTIGRKIWTLSLTVYLLLGSASLCVYWHLRDALAGQRMVIAVKWPAAQVFSDAQASMNLSRMIVRDALLDRQNPVKFAADVERYRKTTDILDSCAEKLVELSRGFQKEENKERVRSITANLPAMHESERLAIEAARKGDDKAALAAVRSALPQTDIVRQMLTELQQQNNTLTSNIFQNIQSDMSTSVLWLLCCFAAVLCLGAIVSWRLARDISHNASRLCARAQQIASGDLTGEPLMISGQDEFAELAASMNRMEQQLQQLLLKISATSNELAGASEEISGGSAHSAETSRQQTDQTNMVATAIHEMSATVMEVSQHSQAAASAAANAAGTAQEGGALVRNTLEAMNRISDSNQKIAERVTKLGESSQQVGKIASVIDDIADQTNLLALNAAIEAARAGEQGRGFAVVADEVRKLAERTTAATKEIAQILDAILIESQNTAQAMNEGKHDVEAGLDGSRQAGDALERIIGMATKVGDMVAQIATAATEQASATDEIQNSAQRIAGMASDSNTAAGRSAEACERLSSLALRLQEIVGRFHVQDNHGALRDDSVHLWSSQSTPHIYAQQ
jgi:methyl-accepting chemotaxis protein